MVMVIFSALVRSHQSTSPVVRAGRGVNIGRQLPAALPRVRRFVDPWRIPCPTNREPQRTNKEAEPTAADGGSRQEYSYSRGAAVRRFLSHISPMCPHRSAPPSQPSPALRNYPSERARNCLLACLTCLLGHEGAPLSRIPPPTRARLHPLSRTSAER